MSFWTLCRDFLFPMDHSPLPPVESDPMPTDLTTVPQVITDGLADVQAKFDAHQATNAAVVSKQTALTAAQTDLSAAVSEQQSTGQAVTDALKKLTADITAAYTDPTA